MIIPAASPRPAARIWRRRGVALAMLAVAAACGFSSPASAHNYLDSSTPAAGSTLTELPTEFDITTSDALLELGAGSEAFALRVTDSTGLYYGDGCLSISGSSMRTTAALGAAGSYTVTWGVVSADGHPISDSFDFTWAPGGTEVRSEGSAIRPECAVSTSEADDPAGSGEPTPAAALPGPMPDSADPTSSASDSAVGDDAPITPWVVGGVLVIAAALGAGILLTKRTKS